MRVFTLPFALGTALLASTLMLPATADAWPGRMAGSCGCGGGYGGYGGYGYSGYGYGGYGSPGYVSYGGYSTYVPGAYNPYAYNPYAYNPNVHYRAAYAYPNAYAYSGTSYYYPGTFAYNTPSFYPNTYAYSPGTTYYSSPGTYSTSSYLPGGVAPASYVAPANVPNALPSRPAAAETVSIKDGSYEPATVTISAGQVVRWKNDGQKTHTVTANKGDWGSGDVAPGQEFTATFPAAGTFEYYCRFHPQMKGTVIVK